MIEKIRSRVDVAEKEFDKVLYWTQRAQLLTSHSAVEICYSASNSSPQVLLRRSVCSLYIYLCKN